MWWIVRVSCSCEGLPLARTVDRRLSVDLELFSRGGLLVLDKIERQEYRVLHNRPAIGKLERVRLLLATLARAAFTRGCMTRSSGPTRTAAAWLARRLEISTTPFCCCRSRSAMRCAQSTRSCATATI